MKLRAIKNIILGPGKIKVDLLGIIEHMPGNVYWKDKSGAFLGCNQNVATIAGFDSPSDLLGKTEFDLFPPEIAEKSREIDSYVFENQKEKILEEEGLDINGNRAIYLTIKKPLYNANRKQIIGILGISQNITERKRQEEELAHAKERAEAANKAKSVFISTISHDMRTPLSGLLGALELIQLQVTPASKLEELFNAAKKCGQRLRDTVDRVINFARHEHATIAVNKQPVAIKQLIIDILDMHKPIISDKPVALNLNYTAPELFLTDYHCTQDILQNLIGNAIKYTEEGEVNISVEGDEKALKISVQDTGIGIPADMHEAIFDKFTRVVRSDRSKYPGDGLGLSRVKLSIAALDGEIVVHSKPGQGSTFEVYLGA